MKKRSAWIRLILFLLLLAVGAAVLLRQCVTFDHSAVRSGTGFTWNGYSYNETAYDVRYQSGRTLAKTNDEFQILAVRGDTDHRVLVLSSFTDQTLCVREDYEIPTASNLNGVYWGAGSKKITDKDFLRCIDRLLQESRADFQHETSAIWSITDTCRVSPPAFCFEDSPVGVQPHDDHLGLLDGEWVYARLSSYFDTDDGRTYVYDIYRLSEENTNVIRRFWGN